MSVCIGAGLVVLVLCGAWIFFCCAMYKDKQTQQKIRQRWRAATRRARNVTRAFSRRTQRVSDTLGYAEYNIFYYYGDLFVV